MDSDTWNAYHIISNRARSVCYATRQQLFRRRAEHTVNSLISTATSQLDAMKDLKVEFTVFTWMCISRKKKHQVLHCLFSTLFAKDWSARIEGTDYSLLGQAGGWSQRSAGSTGETVRRPGADGEFAEGQPAASQPGKSPDCLWTAAGRSAHSGHYTENG